MATVHIPPQMQDLTGGLAEVEAGGGSLRQVVNALEESHPGICERLIKEDMVAPGLAVSIDNVVTSRGLFAEVGPDSVIHIIPAISGGLL